MPTNGIANEMGLAVRLVLEGTFLAATGRLLPDNVTERMAAFRERAAASQVAAPACGTGNGDDEVAE